MAVSSKSSQAGPLKMLRSRNGLMFILAIILIVGIFNFSSVLPGTSLSKLSHAGSSTPPVVPISPKLSQALEKSQGSSKSSSANITAPNAVALDYFGQVYAQKTSNYDFLELKEYCAATTWPEDGVYLQCGGMSAGLTTIMSQLKVCLKMAVEAGTGLILPSMPLRDSKNLQEFNFNNGDAYMPYDKWFDDKHLIESLAKACPRMKVLHPSKLDLTGLGLGGPEMVEVKYKWSMDLAAAPGYLPFAGLFWVGKPFKTFFDSQLIALEQMAEMNPNKDPSKKGITVISISSQFLIYRIMDDPTQGDLRLWNDLGMLIRFKEDVRAITGALLSLLEGGDRAGRGWYGVHFRVESDTIWSGLDHQLAVDLDALDLAWTKYGSPTAAKPLVYLACGDQVQVAKFVEAGAERGWEVVHKWALAAGNGVLEESIGKLPFDFQGAVDMGVMVKAGFFLGIQGSAFSSSIANVRDERGRYRGSSLEGRGRADAGARTHLFNDGDAGAYACCL